MAPISVSAMLKNRRTLTCMRCPLKFVASKERSRKPSRIFSVRRKSLMSQSARSSRLSLRRTLITVQFGAFTILSLVSE